MIAGVIPHLFTLSLLLSTMFQLEDRSLYLGRFRDEQRQGKGKQETHTSHICVSTVSVYTIQYFLSKVRVRLCAFRFTYLIIIIISVIITNFYIDGPELKVNNYYQTIIIVKIIIIIIIVII